MDVIMLAYIDLLVYVNMLVLIHKHHDVLLTLNLLIFKWTDQFVGSEPGDERLGRY